MAEPIEEVFVSVGADISKLLSGIKKGTDEASKEMDEFGKKSKKTFSQLESSSKKATSSVQRIGQTLKSALKIFKLAAAAATALVVVFKLFPGIANKFSGGFKVMLDRVVKFSRVLLPLINNVNKFFNAVGAGAAVAKGGAIFGALALGAAALAATIAVKLTKAVTDFFIKFGKAAVSANAEFETFTTQFDTLLGSSSLAKKRLEELAKFGIETPFELPQVVEASRVLQVFGGNALATGDNLRMIGDIAAGVNRPFEEVALWVGRMNDAMQSGRPFGEAAARLQEMGAVSGQTRAELEKMAKEGASGAELWERFNELVGSKFAGNMERLSKTFKGITSNLVDFRDNMIRIGGEALFDKVRGDAEKLLDIISEEEMSAGIENVAKSLGDAAAELEGLATAPFFDTLEGIEVEQLNALAESIRNAAKALGELLGGERDFSGFLDMFTVLINSFTTFTNTINSAKANVSGFSIGLENTTEALFPLVAAVKDLIRGFELLDKISEQLYDESLVEISEQLAQSTETVAQKAERARAAEADRWQGLADMHAAQQEATKSNDDLNESLEETEEVSDAAAKAIDNYASDLLDLQEDTAEQSAQLEKQHTEALTEIQDEYTEALAEAAQEREKALVEAEKQRIDALADLEAEVTKRRKDIISKAQQELSDLAEDTNRTLEKERSSFNQEELRETENHLDNLRQLRQRYLSTIADAVKTRDARALVDARRQFQQEQSEQESGFQTQQRRRREDQDLRLQEIREQEQLRANEIMRAQETELLSLMEHEQEKRAQIEESYQEQIARAEEVFEEQTARAQEQRDEALAKEEENYQREKEQLESQMAERLETIAKGLADQDDITDEEAQAILETLAKYFGVDGEIDKLMEAFANRRRAKLEIQVAFETGGEAPPPTGGGGGGPGPFGGGGGSSPHLEQIQSFQHGGTMIARRPTLAQFGEVPEMVQFTPLNQMNNNANRDKTINLRVEMSGSAPPGIRSGDRDQIANVLVNALRESGMRVGPGS